MNDPQVLVTSKANPTGVWIDLVQCCNAEDFKAEVASVLNTETEDYVISDSTDVPKCFIKNGVLSAEAFDYAKEHEHDRTVIFAYSTISTDIDQYLARNALGALRSVNSDRQVFAKSWVRLSFDLADIIYDSLDWEAMAKKLEDQYIFVDIASKTYVFHK
jgi:hypothetical protein